MKKYRTSTFDFNLKSFENKPLTRFLFLVMLACSQDIHLLKHAN